MQNPVKISIVVTNHNYGHFIRECLDSVLAQTYRNLECVVVDDGSTDESRDIIAGYPMFKTLLQENTGQAVAARNGLRHCSGDVVMFLDTDDYLLPQTCAEVAHAFTDSPNLVAFHFRLQIHENGALTPRSWPDDRFREGDEQIECLFRFGYVPAAPTSGNAYARSYVDLVFREGSGLYFNSFDSWLAYSAPIVGNTAHSEKILGVYRIHSDNLTTWRARRAVSRAKMGLFYGYHAQATARKLAAQRGIALPAWDFLNGPYDLKWYLLMRGVSIPKTDLPPRSAWACATQSAKTFLAMTNIPLTRRLSNVVIVYLLAAATPALRRRIGERFYNLDFSR